VCSKRHLRLISVFLFDVVFLQAAWRAKVWKTAEEVGSSSKHGFHQSALVALRSLVGGDAPTLQRALQTSRAALLDDLARSSIETAQSVYPVMARLQFLDDVQHAWSQLWSSPLSRTPSDPLQLAASMSASGSLAGTLDMSMSVVEPKRKSVRRQPSEQEAVALLGRWTNCAMLTASGSHFEDIEPNLALRKILLSLIEKPHIEQEFARQYARAARKARRYEIASSVLHSLENSPPRFGHGASMILVENTTNPLNNL
jgi:hypothetical protein